MFDLVADVERYPEFVPLCQSLQVRRRATDAAGVEVLTADMKVGYRAIRESFTTRVTLDRANMKILVEYIDGPFSWLENVWTFSAEAEAGTSRVEFFIDYEFRSRMLGALMGSMFDAAFRKFAERSRRGRTRSTAARRVSQRRAKRPSSISSAVSTDAVCIAARPSRRNVAHRHDRRARPRAGEMHEADRFFGVPPSGPATPVTRRRLRRGNGQARPAPSPAPSPR